MVMAVVMKVAAIITVMIMIEGVAAYRSGNHEKLQLHPVVVVPGHGGSQLEGRLTGEYKGSCGTQYLLNKDEEGWFSLDQDAGITFQPLVDCFAQLKMLYYDPDMDDYHNAPGVETRVPHFGSAESLVNYFDPHLKLPLVESLEEIGYRERKNLFGAPYDNRYGLASQGHPSRVGSKFLQDLKELIENATAANDGKPVILISSSQGGLYALQLLNRNTYSWRQKYIKHYIAISTGWGGSVPIMQFFAPGGGVDPIVLDQQRSTETSLWALPTQNIFGSTRPLVVAPNSNYSAADISRFLNDVGFPQGVLRYRTRIVPLVENLGAPGIPVTCYIGGGIQTPETLIYRGGFDEQPEILYGDGDGIINMVSLLSAQHEWASNKNQTLKIIKFPGLAHGDISTQQTSLARILEEITSINVGIVSTSPLVSST